MFFKSQNGEFTVTFPAANSLVLVQIRNYYNFKCYFDSPETENKMNVLVNNRPKIFKKFKIATCDEVIGFNSILICQIQICVTFPDFHFMANSDIFSLTPRYGAL